MNLPCLGIDIAKVKFNACLLPLTGKLKHKVFSNNAAGFAQLGEWLEKLGVERAHACLEATGTYGEALAIHLHQQGHTVSVMNPAAIKAFAASRLSRTKTDRVDAELIARFCLAHQPPPWTPPAPEVRELQALVRRLESLIEMRMAEENRLSAGITVAVVRSSVEEMIRSSQRPDHSHGETDPQPHRPAPRLEAAARAAQLHSRYCRHHRGRAPGRSAGHQTVSQRATGGGLRRLGAA